MSNDIEKLRTRWRRWLGNKTRADKPHWTTLLQSNWSGWAESTLRDNGQACAGLSWGTPREIVKAQFAHAIDVATMRELADLDGVYAAELVEKLSRR
jgi:hypothetical protein